MAARTPKGITARLRARKARKDAAVATKVRALVEARDGYCRYGKDMAPVHRTPCRGVSQWAHFGPWKRFKTRGVAPEQRHCVEGSLMLCLAHHAEYDAGRLLIVACDDIECCESTLRYARIPW